MGDGSELWYEAGVMKLSFLQNCPATSHFREEYTNISVYSDNSSCIYSPSLPDNLQFRNFLSQSVHILVFNYLSMAWLIELSMGYYCQFLNPSRVLVTTTSYGNKLQSTNMYLLKKYFLLFVLNQLPVPFYGI